MHDLIDRLTDSHDLIPAIAIVGGLLIAAIAIIFGSVRAMVVGSAREKTKQELAAYVAAGTLDPDKAVAMINAGAKSSDGACA